MTTDERLDVLTQSTRFKRFMAAALEMRGDDAPLEEVILDAIVDPKSNHHRTPLAEIHRWLKRAGREKMLKAGEPLPGAGPFVLYRAVSGTGRRRRPRGISWTDSLNVARFFRDRFGFWDPAILTMTIGAEHVYAYTNERRESEFVVIVPRSAHPVRLS